jgi:hypothetical protein
VAGPDDLLRMLVQHWAPCEHVYSTENDRHDVATIMLFQAYTGGRPAEFVHASKGKASEDPLGEREKTSKKAHSRKAAHCNYDDEPESDDDSDDGDKPGSDDDVLFDSDDDGSDDGIANEDMDGHGCLDSGYC